MGGGSGGARGAGFGGFAGAGAGARKTAAAQACAAAAHAAAGVMKDDSMGMGRVSLAHPSAASCPSANTFGKQVSLDDVCVFL